MVARITTPSSLHKTLNYNEQKCQKGTAVCIGENGFLLPVNKMNFYEKKERFEDRNWLNERAETKTLHVSLNFHNDDRLDRGLLLRIADDYMQRIGFGEQPYLVYHHSDAGHPHIHILSTIIRADGSRINTHNFGRNQSEFARKVLEEKYGLVKAENQSKVLQKIVAFDLKKVEYGKSETRRGIANVLHGVLNTYNYTSLPELNAVLRQFNVFADRGAPGSFVHTQNGLTYRVLDQNGNKVGVPIKASLLPGKPTLSYLDKRYEQNAKKRDVLKSLLAQKIVSALQQKPESITALAKMLLLQNVVMVKRQNEEGKMFGITFVDHANRSVFNGSDVGRQFSVANLLKQMNAPPEFVREKMQQGAGNGLIEFNGLSLVADMMQPENDFNLTPYQLKKRKKKRKL